MKSGELAKMTGVSADTLHHYERMGVLTPSQRHDNGYREYGPEAIERVSIIRKALKLGFTLAELAPLFKQRDGGGTPCAEVRALAAAKLKETNERLQALTQLRDQLVMMVGDWDERLEKTRPGQQARLFERMPNLEIASPRPKKGRQVSRN